jgi:DNA-binding transcriptional LysR family regulator
MAKTSVASVPDNPLQDTKVLRLLNVLYTTGSVTRAASMLGQSQPTVSIWLSKARAQVGDPLFVRTVKGMQPTPRMDGLIQTVREVLNAFDKLAQTHTPFDAASSQREFRIYMTDASHITLLPHLFSHVRKVAPGVRLSAAAIGVEMAAALQNGEADLAIGFITSLEAGFYQQSLYEQDWVCLCDSRHPEWSRKNNPCEVITKKQYANANHVNIASGTGANLLDKAMKMSATPRKIQLELPGFLGLSGILSSTDLLATLPRQIGETLAKAANLQILNCPVAIPSFTVKQHWHSRYHEDGANKWLRGVVAELFLRSKQREIKRKFSNTVPKVLTP